MAGFLFAADLHLQPNAWVNRKELHGDAWFALSQIVDLSIQKRLPLVLGGDIFDSPRPDSGSIGAFLEAVYRLRANNIALYAIDGNHDVSNPSLAGTLGAINIDNACWDIGGIECFGMKWRHMSAVPDYLAHVPAGRVLIAHQSWAQLQGGSTCEADAAMCPQVRAVISGDLHEYLEVKGPVPLFSPGSTCLQATNEPVEKYVMEFQQEGLQLNVTQHRILSRPLINVRVDNQQQLASVCTMLKNTTDSYKHLPEVIRKPIVVIERSRAVVDAEIHIDLAAGDNWHVFHKPFTDGTAVELNPVATPVASMTVADRFHQVASEVAPAEADHMFNLIRSATNGRQNCLSFLEEARAEFVRKFEAESAARQA